jgi:uncharacterized phage protein (TIGR01671 family)
MKKEFRVWDKSRGRFLNSEPSDLIYLYSHIKARDLGGFSVFSIVVDNIVVQYATGALDKYGMKIYEGDIVIYRNKNREIRIGQYFDGEADRSGYFIQDPKFPHGNFGTGRLSDFEKCEIIGNIMENPELLTNKQQ